MRTLTVIEKPPEDDRLKPRRLPEWLRRPLPTGNENFFTQSLLTELGLADFQAGAEKRLRFAVLALPLISGRHCFLDRDARRTIFARFHLVANHRHFTIKVFSGNKRIKHSVGFKF